MFWSAGFPVAQRPPRSTTGLCPGFASVKGDNTRMLPSYSDKGCTVPEMWRTTTESIQYNTMLDTTDSLYYITAMTLTATLVVFDKVLDVWHKCACARVDVAVSVQRDLPISKVIHDRRRYCHKYLAFIVCCCHVCQRILPAVQMFSNR